MYHLYILCDDIGLVSLLFQMPAQLCYFAFLVSRLLLPSYYLHFLIQRILFYMYYCVACVKAIYTQKPYYIIYFSCYLLLPSFFTGAHPILMITDHKMIQQVFITDFNCFSDRIVRLHLKCVPFLYLSLSLFLSLSLSLSLSITHTHTHTKLPV